MKHIFIINPISGKRNGEKTIPVIEEICTKNDFEYEIYKTEYPGHATEIAKEISNENTCLYAVGGDGTVLEVLNGIHSASSLAIIPVGTGNDFYRAICDKEMSIEEILKNTILGKEIQTDLGKSNEDLFLNVASFGMDAQVNYLVQQYRDSWIPKKLIYMVAAIQVILHPSLTEATIFANGEEIHVSALLISIFNGQYYGGGFHPSPDSKINDGIFNICYVDNISVFRLPFILMKYFKGKHRNLKECHFLDATELVVDAKQPVYMQIDGENKNVSRYEFTCLHNQLTLRVPHQNCIEEA